MNVNSILNRLERGLFLMEDFGRIATIVAMTGIVAFQVIMRVVFKWSSPALEEAARFIMIWSIFIGAIVTTREDGHIKMGGLFNSGVKKIWFDLLATSLCLVFMIIFVNWSWEFAIYSIEKSMRSIVLRLPLIVVHICFFVCSIFIVFHFFINLMKKTKTIINYYKGIN